MTTMSVISVRCRTSRTLTLTAFMSSSALLTMRSRVCGMECLGCAAVRREAVLVAISLRLLLGPSITPGRTNDLAHGVRHQESRVTARIDNLAQFCRRYFELGNGMYVDAAGRRPVQGVHRSRTAIHHEFAERALGGGLPAGPVANHDMREIEQLTPAVPVRHPQERVHAEQQAQRSIRIF